MRRREWSPSVNPPPKGYGIFFLGLSHFLILFLDWAGSGTFFFLLWSRAAAAPKGASVPRGQTCCLSSFSYPRLRDQSLEGLEEGREPPPTCPNEGRERWFRPCTPTKKESRCPRGTGGPSQPEEGARSQAQGWVTRCRAYNQDRRDGLSPCPSRPSTWALHPRAGPLVQVRAELEKAA